MRDLVRPAIIICIIMLVPLLPFALFGKQLESVFEDWSARAYSAPITAGVIVGVLATDVFLPVPSSVISTMGGWQLGAWLGTAASWLGMSLGATIGFAIARRWGRPVALRISDEAQLDRMHASSERYGPLVLVITRGVPVFAEASVLLMGVNELSWRRFLLPVLLSNFGVALAYSAFGDYAQQNKWLPLALGISIALPVVLAMLVTRLLPHQDVCTETIADDTE